MIKKIHVQLVMTCPAHPEQYDVLDNRKRCYAYLRLRHGHFTVRVPKSGGEVVYESDTKGDGLFDEEEREYQLENAMKAIQKEYKKQNKLLIFNP